MVDTWQKTKHCERSLSVGFAVIEDENVVYTTYYSANMDYQKQKCSKT